MFYIFDIIISALVPTFRRRRHLIFEKKIHSILQAEVQIGV